MSEDTSLIGQLIGNYRVVRQIGQGGMGAVYEAVHEQIHRRAAIKVLRPEISQDRQVAQRFFNEARAINIVDHPGMVEIFDFGHRPDGTAFIIMELLKGETLSARLKRTRMSVGADVLRLTRQVASALVAAHDKGIIHRDLKPDNVMIVPDPEASGGERAKILDFGIAKVAQGQAATGEPNDGVHTATFAVMGTPAYIAPEQCQGARNVTAKADVYALGVMLYEMLGGRRPFEADSAVALMFSHMSAEPPPIQNLVPTLPQPLIRLVHSMLAKNPDERPAMAEVAVQMERLGAATTGAMPIIAGPADPVATSASGNLSTLGLAAGPIAAAATAAVSVAPATRPHASALGMGPPVSSSTPTPAPVSVSATAPAPSFTPAPVSTTAAPMTAAASGAKRNLVLLIGMGAGVGLALIVWLSRQGLSAPEAHLPESAAHTAPAAPAAVPTASATVRWVVESDPPGAEVVRVSDGQVLAVTPWNSEQPRGGGTLKLRLRRAGFLDEELTLDREHDETRRQTLRPSGKNGVQRRLNDVMKRLEREKLRPIDDKDIRLLE